MGGGGGERGAPVLFIAWTSHCGSFSDRRAWALDVRASVVAAHGLGSCGSWAPRGHLQHGLSGCDTQAQLLLGTCNFPGPGVQSVFPELAHEFLSTEPPAKFLL